MIPIRGRPADPRRGVRRDGPGCNLDRGASRLSLLTLNDASFDFGREPILAGVNLALRRDVRYALVGPNGAGKTTLLEILAGERTLLGGQRALTGGISMHFLRQTSRLALPGVREQPGLTPPPAPSAEEPPSRPPRA
jgi:ABC-type uncharacterized transport system fused permease/ATPase subunit